MRITLPSGTAAEVVCPPAPTRGVVVIPDIMGLRPLFDDHVAALARDRNWAVAAVEPFPGREDIPLDERLATGVASLDDERVLGDAAAAADELGTGERTAVLGFCMGGMYVLKAAGTGRLDRGVAFYGMIRLPERFDGPGHAEPLDWLARRAPGACPVLAIVGGRDSFTPPDDIAALKQLPDVEVVEYPDAEHGFVHDASRETHRAADAADAWRRVADFLA
jgi:carboxymethylenebutenolidase